MSAADFETVFTSLNRALTHDPHPSHGGKALTALRRIEQRQRELEKAGQEVETLAFRQYIDWMHFHELAMTKPFEAEIEAQDFARRVLSLLTIALGDASSIKETSK